MCKARRLHVRLLCDRARGGLPDFGNPAENMPGDATFIERLKKGVLSSQPICAWNGPLPAVPPEPDFQNDTQPFCAFLLSLPTRGVWIEITTQTATHAQSKSSLPARGATIEIIEKNRKCTSAVGLSPRGTWIEILRQRMYIIH